MKNAPKLFRCAVCEKEKPYEEMRKDKRYKSGVAALCNECRRTRRIENGEYLRERMRSYGDKRGGGQVLIKFEEMQTLMSRKNCAYCGDELTLDFNAPNEQCIDHIFPLGDAFDGYGAANLACNLTTVCRHDNQAKGQLHVYDYYQKSERFTDELWHAFVADYGSRLFGRKMSPEAIEQLKCDLRDEAAELAEWKSRTKGVPV